MTTKDDAIRKIESLDCRDVVRLETGLHHVSRHKNDGYKCPFHNETNGMSFVVWEVGAKCYGACQKGWNTITFIMDWRNLSHDDAVKYLYESYCNGDSRTLVAGRGSSNRPKEEKKLTPSEPPSAEWQAGAWLAIKKAEQTLWSDAGKPARDYLHKRGLTDDTIHMARLGYVQGKHTQWRVIVDGWGRIVDKEWKPYAVPAGIIIPWIANGAVWAIKTRRASGADKYQQVAGGNIRGCLYLADTVQAGQSLLTLEGEFNALIAYQMSYGFFSVAGIGSAGNIKNVLNPRWYPVFAKAKRHYSLFDNDEAGHSATAYMRQCLGDVHPVAMPMVEGVNDINDIYQAKGHTASCNWIHEAVR